MSDVVREDADYNRFLILELANLELDSKIGKDRHFIAADRKNNRRIVLGLFSVIGTAVIASKAIKDVFQAVPQISEYETIFISVVSLLVGVSTAILGFLGLEKQVAQHRFVGNMYIEVARKARALISRLQEGESSETIRSELNNIMGVYLNVNKEGESCPTSKKDSIKSLAQNSGSRQKIKNEIKRQDDILMALRVHAKSPTLNRMVCDGVKIKIARFLCFVCLIEKSDRDAYVESLK